MADVKWIKESGTDILLMDFSSSEITDVHKAIEKAKPIIAKQPPNSILGIVDVSNSSYDKDLTQALKDFATHNKPFMKVSAVVGVEGIKKLIFQGVLKFSGRKNLVLMDSRQDAINYLKKQ